MEENDAIRFARLLAHKNVNLRRAGAMHLGISKVESQTACLLKALHDTAWQVRESAATALGQIGHPRAYEFLIKRLGCADDNIRTTALELLSRQAPTPAEELAETKAMPRQPAHEAVESSMRVRQALALAVARVRSDLFEKPLLDALASPRPEVKVAALSGLANLGFESASASIIPLCESPEQEVKRAAVVALGRLRCEAATAILSKVSAEDVPSIRLEAVIALNNIKSPGAFPALAKSLTDPEPKVRAAAALAVGNSRHEDAADKLIPLLEDSIASVRQAACQSLFTLKARDRMPDIAVLLLDESEEICITAANTYCALAVN